MSESKTGKWTVDCDHDVRVASWRVAELIYGEDDGSMGRDDIEYQIQEVIAQSFDFTTTNDGPELRAECRGVAESVVMQGDLDDLLDGGLLDPEGGVVMSESSRDEQLALFGDFVRKFEDVGHFARELERLTENRTLEEQEDRLNQAWVRLSEFTQAMGPDFVRVASSIETVRCCCDDCCAERRAIYS